MGNKIKHTVVAGYVIPTRENIKIPPESAKKVNIEIGEGIEIPTEKSELVKVNGKSILKTEQGMEIEMYDPNAYNNLLANINERNIIKEKMAKIKGQDR